MTSPAGKGGKMNDLEELLAHALSEIRKRTAHILDIGSEEDFLFNEIDDIATDALARYHKKKAERDRTPYPADP
jgi:hypothetical protein